MSCTEQKKQEPVFRPAVLSDGPAVTKLVFDVLAEYGLKHDPEGTDADLKDICKSYHESGGAFFVLEECDAGIVGSYALYERFGFVPHETDHLSQRCDHACILEL